jgi:hypothetical protein
MVIDSYFIPIFAKLPFGNGNFTRFNWRGWEFKDKYRAHEEIGDIFMLVTPGRNWIYLCNPEALLEVLKNNQRFPRPLELFEMVNVFGDNLSNVRPTSLFYLRGFANCRHRPRASSGRNIEKLQRLPSMSKTTYLFGPRVCIRLGTW